MMSPTDMARRMNNKNRKRQQGQEREGPSQPAGSSVRRRKRECDSASRLTSEVLLLPDGRVLVHDLTPVFADLLRQLSPNNPHWAALGEASIGMRHTACRAAQAPPQRTERDSDAST